LSNLNSLARGGGRHDRARGGALRTLPQCSRASCHGKPADPHESRRFLTFHKGIVSSCRASARDRRTRQTIRAVGARLHRKALSRGRLPASELVIPRKTFAAPPLKGRLEPKDDAVPSAKSTS